MSAKTKAQDRTEIEMSKANRKLSPIPLSRVIDLLVEHRIKLDALEYVLKETNPLVHELYVGAIENLQAKKAAELKRVVARRLKSEGSED